MSTTPTLADLPPARDGLLFIGLNPSPVSVEAGHYHQGKLGQTFWRRLMLAADPPAGTAIETADEALVAAGHGITDLLKAPTARDEATDAVLRAGVGPLWQKIALWRPAAVVFIYKRAAEIAAGRDLPEPWGHLQTSPSPAGRASCCPGPTPRPSRSTRASTSSATSPRRCPSTAPDRAATRRPVRRQTRRVVALPAYGGRVMVGRGLSRATRSSRCRAVGAGRDRSTPPCQVTPPHTNRRSPAHVDRRLIRRRPRVARQRDPRSGRHVEDPALRRDDPLPAADREPRIRAGPTGGSGSSRQAPAAGSSFPPWGTSRPQPSTSPPSDVPSWR